jgi:hypothetical protein
MLDPLRTMSQPRNANTWDAIAQTFRAVCTKADKGSGGEGAPYNLLSRQKNSSASFLILSHRNIDRNEPFGRLVNLWISLTIP